MGRLGAYGAINARLRTRLSKQITGAELNALVEAESMEEALLLLSDTEFGELADVYQTNSDLRDVERYLVDREIGLLQNVLYSLEGSAQEFAAALFNRYEVEELKMTLRVWHSSKIKHRPVDKDAAGISSKLSRFDAGQILACESLDGIAEVLSDTAYAEILRERAPHPDAEWSLYRLEISLDNYYYRVLQSAATKLPKGDAGIAAELVRIEIDRENLDRIARLREFYRVPEEGLTELLIPSPSGSVADLLGSRNIVESYIASHYPDLSRLLPEETAHTGLVLLEMILGEVLMMSIRRALRGNPFSLGIVLAYFFLLRAETRRLLTILAAKIYGIHNDRVAGLL